ncbi:MAG TPA: preprotein translocase subunit SecE [Streptosporangiaceae bacterium]|jgi:preprotein translocase subunit SecE|nr:preprotein translocase subunit SecE [Streptosporangiaceae bacterium]
MATQTDQAPAERPTRPGRPAKGSRTTPVVFVRQVVAELRKVIWPTRHELVTYTTVALIFIVVMVAIVTGLDALLGKIVLEVFG